MIKFYAIARKNPVTRELRFYPQVDSVTPVTLPTIVELIEKRSTVSSSDCKAVLDALQFEIKEALMRGDSVRLGDLGSFRVTLTGSAAETEKECTAENIKTVRIRFTPSATLQKHFSMGKGSELTFQKISKTIVDETVTE